MSSLFVLFHEGAVVMVFPIRQVVVKIEEIVLTLVVVGRDDHVVAILCAQIFVGMLHPHHLVPLEHDGLRRAQHPLGDDATQAVVVVEHILRLVVIVGEIGGTQLPTRPLLGEQPG